MPAFNVVKDDPLTLEASNRTIIKRDERHIGVKPDYVARAQRWFRHTFRRWHCHEDENSDKWLCHSHPYLRMHDHPDFW